MSKRKRVRRPASEYGTHFDFYADHFAEKEDPLHIDLHIDDLCFKNTKKGISDLRKFIRHLGRCADYLDANKLN